VRLAVALDLRHLDERLEPGPRVRDLAGEGLDLRARFLDVLDDIRSRYVLSYVPQEVGFPGWHALEVSLKQGRGEVWARPGYHRTASP
jgi:hypothetical protein